MHLQNNENEKIKVKFQTWSSHLHDKERVLANIPIIVLIQVILHLCANKMQLVKGFCKQCLSQELNLIDSV